MLLLKMVSLKFAIGHQGVLPGVSCDCSPGDLVGNTEFPTEKKTVFSGGVTLPHFKDNSFSQFGSSVGRATRACSQMDSCWVEISTKRSTFLDHVLHVVPWGTKEKMRRANTRRVVTSVENIKSCRNSTMSNLPGSSMCVSSATSSEPDSSVTVGRPACCPDPTARTFLDVTPEIYPSHNRPHFIRVSHTFINTIAHKPSNSLPYVYRI